MCVRQKASDWGKVFRGKTFLCLFLGIFVFVRLLVCEDSFDLTCVFDWLFIKFYILRFIFTCIKLDTEIINKTVCYWVEQ